MRPPKKPFPFNLPFKSFHLYPFPYHFTLIFPWLFSTVILIGYCTYTKPSIDNGMIKNYENRTWRNNYLSVRQWASQT
jgi:hypothetical protein